MRGRLDLGASGFALCLLAAWAWLYAHDAALARAWLSRWGFRPYDVPFIDLEYVTANVRCWQHGVDVYAATPCDRMGRIFDYAPLWLRLSPLALDWSWSNRLGLAQGALWCASLSLLGWPRGLAGRALLVAAVASPVCGFAIERGNPDVVVFVLAAGALACWRSARAGWRLLGWALVGLAGGLKFYPAVLGLMLARERPALGLRAGALLGVAGLAYLAAWHGEILRALHNLPSPGAFSMGFGAQFLARGLGVVTGSRHLHRWLGPVLLAGLGGAVVWLARREGFARTMRGLAQPAQDSWLVGGLLVAGCFLSGPSVGYRAVLLLLAMPGLLALRAAGPRAGRGVAVRLPVWASVCVLWCSLPMRWLAPADSPAQGDLTPLFTAVWLLREALWWGVVWVLLAGCWVLLAPGLRRYGAMLARLRPARG